MFYKHVILNVNDEEILYLYLTDIYEISNEFKKNKSETIYNKVNNYLYNMNVNFTGNKVMLVINNIIMGTLNIYDKETKYPIFKFRQLTDNFLVTKNLEIINIDDDFNEIKDYVSRYQKKPIYEKLSPSIKVIINDKVINTDINTYLTNKLIKTIPIYYDIETLKSYGVILRTKMFKELLNNKIIKDNEYIEKDKLLKLYNNLDNFYEKAREAILSTDKEYLVYDTKKIIDLKNNKIGKYHIGISSLGANCLAKLGYDYKQILKRYYPYSNIKLHYI